MSSPNDRYRKYGCAASFRKRRGVAECPIAAIPAIAARGIERGGDAKRRRNRTCVLLSSRVTATIR
jgi:hypothetical protein